MQIFLWPYRACKLVAVFATIFAILMVSFLLHLTVADRWKRTRWVSHVLSLASRIGLKILNLKVNLKGRVESGAGPYLVVSNHLSYLDTLALAAHFPTCFVTSVEIRETPVLGTITKWANCLFVERRNKDNLHKEVAELTEALSHGVTVTVFPEATSTNGEQILRFRRPLYRAALDSGKPVLPVCLNYRSVGRQPLSRKNRDLVFWYDDMTFLDHLWGVISQGGIEVDVEILDPVEVTGPIDEGYLAKYTQQRVESRFVPCLA